MWSSRVSLSLSAGKRSLQIGHSFHGGVAGPSDEAPTAKPLQETEGKERVRMLLCFSCLVGLRDRDACSWAYPAPGSSLS